MYRILHQKKHNRRQLTTKSDELCRLLGIEAKRIYWGGSGDGIEIYPDLTRPSNFCKLIELKKDKYSNTILRFMLCWYGSSELEDVYNRNDVIDKILEFLQSEDYVTTSELLNQAQRTEWEY